MTLNTTTSLWEIRQKEFNMDLCISFCFKQEYMKIFFFTVCSIPNLEIFLRKKIGAPYFIIINDSIATIVCIVTTSVAPIQQFANMPICLYFIIQIANMQIRSNIVCVKYIVVFIYCSCVIHSAQSTLYM